MAADLRVSVVCGVDRVSILVLLDWGWRRHGAGVTALEPCGFQSLFCWIGDGGQRWHSGRHGRTGVSILVLLDWGWRHIGGGTFPIQLRGFQSLFCWIGDGGNRSEHQAPSAKGFQSLFCWIGDGGVPQVTTGETESGFQSLFCWIGDGGQCSYYHLRWYSHRFQSLFCWIGDGGALPLRVGRLRQCFNPCSVGLGMAAITWLKGVLETVLVSILVLLDWGWRLHLT